MNTAGFITEPWFADLPPQAVFDTAAKHVLANGAKSEVNGRCQYSGIGCAAAPFILPEKRDLADLVGPWFMLVQLMYVPHQHDELMGEITRAHDSVFQEPFIPRWKYRMRRVATNFGLSHEVLGPVTDDEMLSSGASCSIGSCP